MCYICLVVCLQQFQLTVLNQGAVAASMLLHGDLVGESQSAQQRRNEPGAYARPLRWQAYRLFMAWRYVCVSCSWGRRLWLAELLLSTHLRLRVADCFSPSPLHTFRLPRGISIFPDAAPSFNAVPVMGRRASPFPGSFALPPPTVQLTLLEPLT